MTQQVYTVEEAAKYLKCHEQTIYNLIRNKKLLATKVGKEWRIHKVALDGILLGISPEEIQKSYLEGVEPATERRSAI